VDPTTVPPHITQEERDCFRSRGAFVAETLVGPFFMIVMHTFFDGHPERPFAEQHHSVQALRRR
jgi:hypothetical protein